MTPQHRSQDERSDDSSTKGDTLVVSATKVDVGRREQGKRQRHRRGLRRPRGEMSVHERTDEAEPGRRLVGSELREQFEILGRADRTERE
jgi:hypothetical protein